MNAYGSGSGGRVGGERAESEASHLIHCYYLFKNKTSALLKLQIETLRNRDTDLQNCCVQLDVRRPIL